MRDYYVYIMASASNTLYVGITNDLGRRVWEHKLKRDKSSFTARYNIGKLVYFESTASHEGAIGREKQIKGWTRKRKLTLIESANREWRDLSSEWGDTEVRDPSLCSE